MAGFSVVSRGIAAEREKVPLAQLPPQVLSSGSQASPMLFLEAFAAKGDGTTDDTAAIQTAINAANTIGASTGIPCPLRGTPGKTYVIGGVVPASYVDLQLYGCKITRKAAYASNQAFFEINPALGIGSPISHFALRGGQWTGTGSELEFQGLVVLHECSYIEITDWVIDGCSATVINAVDCQHVLVEGNQIGTTTAVGVAGQTNTVSFICAANGNASPLKYVWCRKNHVVSNGVAPIAVTSVSSNRTDPVIDAHITDNTCTATNYQAIQVEQGGSSAPPNISQIDISGNTCTVLGSTGSSYGISVLNDSSTLSTDPLCISAVTIRGNRIAAATQNNNGGIYCGASYTAVEGNQITILGTAGGAGHSLFLSGAQPSQAIHHVTVAGNSWTPSTGAPTPVHLGYYDYATLTMKGNTPLGPITVPVPASGTATTPSNYGNAVPFDTIYYVTAATGGCTMTTQDGQAVVIPAATMGLVKVPAGQTVTPTYTNAPTWVVRGE